jgi:gliding motility-associated-like protein
MLGKFLQILCCLFGVTAGRVCVAQCGYSPKIHTNKDYCVGSSLIATSTHALQNIVWYQNGQPVKTAVGTQSLATQPIDFQITTSYPYSSFADLGSDDAGNLYILDIGMQQVLKWKPGLSDSARTIAGPYLQNPANAMYVDASGNIYLMSADSGVADAQYPALITEYQAGGGDSVVLVKKPLGHIYTYGSAFGMTMDCLHNFYILSLTPYITEWSPGATSGTVLMTDANVPRVCGLEVGFGFRRDRSGNLFFISGGNVRRLAPGSNTPVAVTAYDCQASPLKYLANFWIDADDTVYVNTIIAGTNVTIIDKWAPGATTGLSIITSTGTLSGSGYDPIIMDVKGDIFMFDYTQTGVAEFRRSCSIDSAFNPTDTGAYYAIVTDIQGYSAYTDTIHINSPVSALPSIQISASATSTPVCTPIRFTATVNNAVDPDYQWMVSGVPAGGDSTTYSYNLFANGDKVYCILSAEGGCAGLVMDTSNVIDLSIDPHGTASVTISANKDTVCNGTTMIFTATVLNGSNQPVFEWLLNGHPTGDDSATFGGVNFSTGDVVTCLIVSDDACGLAKSNSIPLIVSVPPVIARDQIFTIPYGQSLTLTPIVTGDVSTWLWTPATWLSDPHIADPVADPTATTLYSLTVEAAGGCGDTATILVNVYTPLAIPNAFTPNGDGRNDRLYVLGGPVKSVVEYFAVFNRWGVAVFSVHDAAPGDANAGWDGQVHGVAAPSGAYVYVVRMRFADGSKKLYTGTVMLIR